MITVTCNIREDETDLAQVKFNLDDVVIMEHVSNRLLGTFVGDIVADQLERFLDSKGRGQKGVLSSPPSA